MPDKPEKLDKTHEVIVDAAIVGGVDVPKDVAIAEKKAGIIREDVAQAASLVETSKTSGGQRRVNLVWEMTQTFIALVVTSTAMGVAAYLATSKEMDADARAAFQLISSAAFLVIGFYFGRTNHQRIGGVGQGEAGR